jgi:hypothetical protein
VVVEIGELDNASQDTGWAGCVGNAFHVGAVVPAGLDRAAQPCEDSLLPQTVSELRRLGISVRKVVVDGSSRESDERRARGPRPQNVLIAAARNLAANAPNVKADCDATEQARRAMSATSNAATGWTDPD